MAAVGDCIRAHSLNLNRIGNEGAAAFGDLLAANKVLTRLEYGAAHSPAGPRLTSLIRADSKRIGSVVKASPALGAACRRTLA